MSCFTAWLADVQHFTHSVICTLSSIISTKSFLHSCSGKARRQANNHEITLDFLMFLHRCSPYLPSRVSEGFLSLFFTIMKLLPFFVPLQASFPLLCFFWLAFLPCVLLLQWSRLSAPKMLSLPTSPLMLVGALGDTDLLAGMLGRVRRPEELAAPHGNKCLADGGVSLPCIGKPAASNSIPQFTDLGGCLR